MQVFRRILHGTDFSSASRPALAKAIALAGQNRVPLQIVHVLAPLELPAGGDFGFMPATTYETIDRAEDARQFLAEARLNAEAIAPQVDGKFLNAFVRARKPDA